MKKKMHNLQAEAGILSLVGVNISLQSNQSHQSREERERSTCGGRLLDVEKDRRRRQGLDIATDCNEGG